jgi:hypothetical protein
VAGNGGAFAGGLAQHFLDGIEAFLRYDGLPGIVADAVREGIEYPACFFEGVFFTLGDEGYHHIKLPFFYWMVSPIFSLSC